MMKSVRNAAAATTIKGSARSLQKMECLICYQAGKPNYIGHRIKDASGKVVCPTLLNQKCHICKQTGHTPKYCTVAKLKTKHDKHIKIKKNAYHITSQSVQENTYANESLTEWEVLGYEECKEDVPWDSTNRIPNSWASIVSKPPPLTLHIPTDDEEPYMEENDCNQTFHGNMDISPCTTPLTPPYKKTKKEPMVETKKKPRPKLWSQYESDEEYE